MPIFPFFQFPYQNRYYPRYIRHVPFDNNKTEHENGQDSLTDDAHQTSNTSSDEKDTTKSSRYTRIGPINFQNPFSIDAEKPVLEILGISLYLDDLIILGLLFFLYQEGVKDEMLFLSLILLLLS